MSCSPLWQCISSPHNSHPCCSCNRSTIFVSMAFLRRTELHLGHVPDRFSLRSRDAVRASAGHCTDRGSQCTFLSGKRSCRTGSTSAARFVLGVCIARESSCSLMQYPDSFKAFYHPYYSQACFSWCFSIYYVLVPPVVCRRITPTTDLSIDEPLGFVDCKGSFDAAWFSATGYRGRVIWHRHS